MIDSPISLLFPAMTGTNVLVRTIEIPDPFGTLIVAGLDGPGSPDCPIVPDIPDDPDDPNGPGGNNGPNAPGCTGVSNGTNYPADSSGLIDAAYTSHPVFPSSTVSTDSSELKLLVYLS